MTSQTCCPATIRLSRPVHDRVLDAVSDTLRDLRAAWRKHAEQRQVQREFEAVANMNELLLRDIGAPEWMISQANVRREADQQRRMELHQGLRFGE